MKNKLIKQAITITILILCMMMYTQRARASWIVVNDELQAWKGWGSSASDVFIVGCQGVIAHYDNNPENSWVEMERIHHS